MRALRTALTIAGSDSGGGAGIQADLKTFAATGVHGTSVVTCVTAQNPARVISVQPISLDVIKAQLTAVFNGLEPAAAKTGMLYSGSIISVVANFLRERRFTEIVVDPVMVSTSGAQLLKPSAMRLLFSELLPFARLITPNLHEAELLLDRELTSVEDLRDAARTLHNIFGCAALVKGGHLPGHKQAIDIFYDGKQELLLAAPFVRGLHTHGTGCTYSAAITANLAKGMRLAQAVREAKEYITQAIAHSYSAGEHTVLNCFWRRR